MADVVIDDLELPAARHLTGPGAHDALAAAVAAGGGTLHSERAVQVQYRPGADLVVRYEAQVTWGAGRPIAETLVAGTVADRGRPLDVAFPGALPVQAATPDGELEVAVWRWPFDPRVTRLATAVTPSALAEVLGLDPRSVSLEVVAYRPTERAVVRARTSDGTLYVKVVPDEAAAPIVARHVALRTAGVPVPRIVAVDDGIIVMAALDGAPLRDRIKAGVGSWPHAGAYLALGTAFGDCSAIDGEGRPGRVRDAIGHARLLRTIVPDQRDRLDRLVERFDDAAVRSAARRGPVIHGDLYEAQLHVADSDDSTDAAIVGVLDVDDAGPGDPLDDVANVLAHLRFRATNAADRGRAGRVAGYARALRRDLAHPLAAAGHDPRELDVVTGAALLGLATGPFRVQQRNWPLAVRAQIAAAERLVDP